MENNNNTPSEQNNNIANNYNDTEFDIPEVYAPGPDVNGPIHYIFYHDPAPVVHNVHGSTYYGEYSDILNKTDYKNNSTIQKIFKENNGLQEFLSKTTPLTNERINALDFIFSKLLTEEKDLFIAGMIAQLGDCNSPVKVFLTEMLVKKYNEKGEEVPQGMIAKIAVGDYLEKNLKEFGIAGKKEAIELKQGFLNALFLAGSENNQHNNYLKIAKKPYFRDSDTNYSFYPQEQEAGFALKFAKMFCKTNESGNLIRENGCYLADQEKIDEITDLYRLKSETAEAKIPSIKKAWEIADKVVNEYFNLDIDDLPNPGFDKKDDNILIVNKAIKDAVKQYPKLTMEEITAEYVVQCLVLQHLFAGRPANTAIEITGISSIQTSTSSLQQ
jgi:hypothetical protein